MDDYRDAFRWPPEHYMCGWERWAYALVWGLQYVTAERIGVLWKASLWLERRAIARVG